LKKRSKQQNRNGNNNQDLELGQDVDLVKQSKKKYEKTGGQPVKSKFHQEKDQSS
jgi:hypothetical protein